MAEVTLMPLIFFTIFYFFTNTGELNPGLCTCWADILPLSYFLNPKYYFFFFLLWLYWAWTQDFLLVKQHSTAWAIYSFPTWVAWARTHCFSNEIRVWSSRNLISFHVSWKVWITEIKAWMYLSGNQYSCLDVFKFPLDLITGRGLTCPLPTIACWRGKHLLRGSEYWSGLEGRNLYRGPQFTFTFIGKV
jgi:hypothetical protein